MYVTQHDFSDPGANHSNSVLAGSDTFDYCYICVTDFILNRRVEVIVVLKAALPKRLRDRDASHAGTRPVKDLGCSVFTENLRFDIGGSYLEFSPEMRPKAQAV